MKLKHAKNSNFELPAPAEYTAATGATQVNDSS